MKDTLISAEDLTVGYKTPLIENISFSVRAGEIMTVIGPNGSGKSTLLKTLAGYLKKHGGKVLIGKLNADDISLKAKAKCLSAALTERIKPELMTCRDVVESGRYPYTGYFGTLSEQDRLAANEAVEMVEMTDFAESDFLEVSDGQRQRVILARAICQQPQILLLDEPTSYLDIYHKIAFLEILQKLAVEKKIAVIVSMHEVELAAKISDHTVWVKNGKVLRHGKPQEVFTNKNICELFDIPEKLYEKYICGF